ncbi:MAG: hypothetical protein NTY83_00365 [Candidatus Micrarchaeota archaeon]|nr:hypothetical protein [Candidatus Micrarchaeota archaeon]
MEKQFDSGYIDKELTKIGTRLRTQIKIFLIGGCAMSLRGLKESTKDMDIVFKNETDYIQFCDSLFGAEYFQPFAIKDEHKTLKAFTMYENKDGFHLDLFVGRVMQKLALSKGMTSRAETYKEYKNLAVCLLSPTDIFLFKGLASEGRIRDLPDMAVLYPYVDWKVLETELNKQKLSMELIDLFSRRLTAFRESYELDIPILKKLAKE